ncbi:NYN domain-containing protein [Tateyamaria pelophila]|uniref:NYN domain-containing protein n=1 Tax=Tateyamaria pelophila TaxID=328415 RepID=UPI001CBFC5F1|nr:hypothetical protein [Tateyamaria pelophila]
MIEGWIDSLTQFTSYQIAFVALISGSAVFLIKALLTRLWHRIGQSNTRWIIIDGSNVMYWKTDKPQLETVREIVKKLIGSGWSVGVVFDANAGYLVSNKYRHDAYFAKKLGLPEERVMVVPKGTPADPFILTAARDYKARIVTNDRFRDWAADYPEVLTAGFLVRMKNRDGRLCLMPDVLTDWTAK